MVDQNSIFGGMLTTLGAAKKTHCDALGVPWQPSYMLIGDANGTDPVPGTTQTKLINQRYRAQLNQLYVSPTDENVLIAELVLPPDVGGWWIRELALEDDDGVFSAIANVAPSYKPLLVQGSGRNQVVRMHIITSGTSNIQLKIDPSVVMATRDYVDRSVRAGPVFTYVSSSRSLKPKELGIVLIDASVAPLTVELPSANAALGTRDVIVHRTDNSIHRLMVKAAENNALKFHTHLNLAGYPFLVLMGAGDWWHLRSDGAGSWWPVGRFDGTPLGRPVFETTTVFNPGGYGALNGQLLKRIEWPWLWDHAQQSGMLYPERERRMEGAWSTGDGKTTFRSPEARGEFLRVLDQGRYVEKSTLTGIAKIGSPIITEVRTQTTLIAGMPFEGSNFPRGTKIIAVNDGEIVVSTKSNSEGPGTWKVAGRVAGSWTSDAFEQHTHAASLGEGTGNLDSLVPASVARGSARLQHVVSHNFSPPYLGRIGDAETRPRNIAYPGCIKMI
jgi:phage-related tail fiber protein